MNSKHFTGAIAGVFALLWAPSALASSVSLGSSVFVERAQDDARVLEPARQLVRGDRVVTVLTWKREGPGGQFTVSNPLPRGLYYQGSASDDEDLSIDGGLTWGRLGTLRSGNRLATAEDVTHVRWRVQSNGATGRIAYSAIVR